MASIKQMIEDAIAGMKSAIEHEEARLAAFIEAVPERFHDMTHEELAKLVAWIAPAKPDDPPAA